MDRTLYTPGTSVIDVTAPGGIDALLAFHRRTFGDATMEAAAPAPAAEVAPPAPVPAPPTPSAPPAPAPAPGDGLPDDPAALKGLIADLRRENASARTNAKTQAADAARQDLVQQLGKALGLVTEGDAAPTPEQLTQQLTAAQTAQRAIAVELAVFRTASQHGADPSALTDSRTFLAKVADLDPAAADFQTKVIEAAKAAATENPKLATAPAVAASTVHHAGGTGEGAATPTSLEEAIAQKMAR